MSRGVRMEWRAGVGRYARSIARGQLRVVASEASRAVRQPREEPAPAPAINITDAMLDEWLLHDDEMVAYREEAARRSLLPRGPLW